MTIPLPLKVFLAKLEEIGYTVTNQEGSVTLKEKILYCIWAALYIICVGLGTVTERGILLRLFLGLIALAFFVPGVLLLHQGIVTDNKKILLRVRVICITSLALTLVMIIVTILTVFTGDAVGTALDDVLNIVSAPMYCSYWRWTSLFLWACLLFASFPRLWRK